MENPGRKRYLLTVAYDGTGYNGWQLQPGVETVEGVLNRCLSELVGEPVHVISASRTDAGVHAYGNVAVFDAATRIPAERLPYAANSLLPADVRVQAAKEVEADFHPRHCNSRKTYEYHIYNAEFPSPTARLYSYFNHYETDVGRMNEAAAILVGEHDFTSFCCARTEKENKVRTLYECAARREGRYVILRVCGSGFLYNMVRIIAGTLLKVGQGQMEPGEVAQILAKKDRRVAGPTLPPQGLFLVEIDFGELHTAPCAPRKQKTAVSSESVQCGCQENSRK